ncbi:MAG TPA: apolipoprotein N-acyltransferase [Spirochaetia bacterium]|nr:apolipoprotein N-acyltransferase [Spirochaetia bacterium]
MNGRAFPAPRAGALLLVALSAGLAVPLLFVPWTAGEYLYAALLVLHALTGILTAFETAPSAAGDGRFSAALIARASEALFSLTAVFFLFSYIYATNANMDYVQRFMSSHGNLRLAPNSTQERLTALARFLPLLVYDGLAVFFAHLRGRRPDESFLSAWALPLSLASGIIFALSFPSFVRIAGLPVLAWVSLVPLFLVLRTVSIGRGIFLGTLMGVIQAMITNYWLGTFNLLTLQFVTVVTAVEYVPFMAAALLVVKRSRSLGFLVFPAAWTVFDWVRSQGFLGYPWGMPGVSQYTFIPLIQAASVTGVWGVTFVVVLFNSVAASFIEGRRAKARIERAPLIVLAAVLAAALGWGVFRIAADAAAPPARAAGKTVRLALVQQDADPRKDDYRSVFETLVRLTNEALAARPDLVVWSETAFVPNIRRWSREDPAKYPLAGLVRDFLAYQKTIGTWLLTGNDDYELITREGIEERLDYNGSVLFSPQGQRVETYHKIHLVPFTEYFPFKTELPALYRMLQNFDAYLWEPGKIHVVFRHPLFSFSTPICFEDSFPGDVRLFARAGAQVILNLSNDYWSLTDTEALQHAANAVFRAVENGRPLVRASASGLTCMVDMRGRITARGPLYEPALLVVDVPVSAAAGETPYALWGDWFPVGMGGLLVIVLVISLVRGRRP